ncbi:MAG: substrate-binding domain-containing protein, partial [Chloroflexi bacterium]|nr:substrate-binding domain-containing protein [Chloroflexota bacterium]
RFPIVQCSEYVDTEIAPAVCIDNYQASRDMMAHLMGLGHTRIALISSDNDYISTKIRTQAYKDSLLQAGLSVNPGYIKLGSSDYSFQSGRACALELLQMDDPPSAIFCISDTFALGSTIAAKELDIPTPQELSISGFDDVEYTTMHHPYITTIAQPCYKLGEVSAQILFDRLEKGPARTGLVHLDHQLVVRESTAKKWIDPSGEES